MVIFFWQGTKRRSHRHDSGRRSFSMRNKLNELFNTKRAFVFAGILILIGATGIVLLVQRVKPGNVTLGSDGSIPVENDANLSQPSDANSGTPNDKYSLRLGLSDGQPQLDTMAVLPQAT